MKKNHIIKNNEVKKLLKFAACNASAWVADFIVFTLLYQASGVYYILSKACSYTLGAFTSYTLNRKFTFRTTARFVSLTLVKFILVNCISIGMSLGSMYIFSDKLGFAVWIAYFLSIIFSFSANYFGNRFWVFKGIDG